MLQSLTEAMTTPDLQLAVFIIGLAGLLLGALLAGGIGLWLNLRRGRELHEREKEQAIQASRLQQLQDNYTELKRDYSDKEQTLSGLQRDNTALKTRLESEQAHYQQQLSVLREARETLTKEFENIANKIFQAKQDQFTKSSKSTLETTLNPFRDQIREFKKQVEDAYQKENAERNKLFGQITELQKQARQIGEDAVSLATALKGSNKTQGNWGEVILERLLEESGLRKGHEYETQVSLKDDTGKRRNPDVIVRLPQNKDIVIDAKVSLLHYETYCSAEDELERQAALKNHVASIKTHIDGLNRKSYESLETIRTLDFVFIFIPIEAAFMSAMENDHGLFQYAYDRHIILVSPTTLLATLRTVENIWRYEKQNKNAAKIAAQAGKLHDQFALVVESLTELGDSIDKSQKAYDKTQKQLQNGRGNLYKRIKDLELLGAKTKRTLPDPHDDDIVPAEDEDDESRPAQLANE